MTGGRCVKNQNIKSVVNNVHNLCNKIACIQCRCLTGFKINFNIVFILNILYKVNKRLCIVIISCNMMSAAKVEPFCVIKILAELFFNCLKSRHQIIWILLAQCVKVKALNSVKQIFSEICLCNPKSWTVSARVIDFVPLLCGKFGVKSYAYAYIWILPFIPVFFKLRKWVKNNMTADF